jgi:predicted MFS family arabinose efflux permease
MSSKSIVMIGMVIGSSIGGFIPNLWGSNFLSMSSVLLTAVGGIIGIWVGYKLSN